MARPGGFGDGRGRAPRQLCAAAAEQGIEQAPSLHAVEIGEGAPEERQMLGEMLALGALHPKVDGVAQGLVVDQPLAGAFEKTLEEAGGVRHRAAGAKGRGRDAAPHPRRELARVVEEAAAVPATSGAACASSTSAPSAERQAVRSSPQSRRAPPRRRRS